LPYFYYGNYYYNSTLLILIPGILLMLFAQWRVKRAYSRYSQIRTSGGQTAAQVAQQLLRQAGIGDDVSIEFIHGSLTDHYDPREHVLRLSADGSPQSIAAIGVAAHEVGHAIQHAEGYLPLKIRSAIYPLVNISSWIAIPLLMIGFFLEMSGLVTAALILYASILVFQFVTLPLEFNASARAKALLLSQGILTSGELEGAASVLNAAAMTYIASTLITFLQFLRLLSMARSRR